MDAEWWWRRAGEWLTEVQKVDRERAEQANKFDLAAARRIPEAMRVHDHMRRLGVHLPSVFGVARVLQAASELPGEIRHVIAPERWTTERHEVFITGHEPPYEELNIPTARHAIGGEPLDTSQRPESASLVRVGTFCERCEAETGDGLDPGQEHVAMFDDCDPVPVYRKVEQ